MLCKERKTSGKELVKQNQKGASSPGHQKVKYENGVVKAGYVGEMREGKFFKLKHRHSITV